jgi:hypothetical protein
MKTYNYVIIKENNSYLAQESALLDNVYLPTKYALIEKQCFKDGSEAINRIQYSNDLQKLSEIAKNYISWYNYPIGIYKDIQGNLCHLSEYQVNYGNS